MINSCLLSRQLLINDWRYCFYQPVVKWCLIVMPLIGFMLGGSSLEEGQALDDLLAQQQVIYVMVLMLLLPVLVAMFAPVVLLRDAGENSHGTMMELIAATPTTKNMRLLVRYSALVGLLLLAVGLVYLTVAFSLSSGLGFQSIANGAENFLIMAVPSVLFISALAFVICVNWPSNMVLYVAIGAIGCGYLLLLSMTGTTLLAGSSMVSLGFYQFMLVADPYGISPFLDGLDGLDGLANPVLAKQVLLNRLLFAGLSAVMVAFGIYRQPSTPVSPTASVKQLNDANKAKSMGLFSYSPLLQLVLCALTRLLKNRVSQLILIVWPLMVFNEVLSGSFIHDKAVAQQLNSIDTLNLVAFDLLPVFAAFVLALWSWFVCWGETRLGFDELIGATPVSNSVMLLSQYLVLCLLSIMLLMLTMLACVVAQLIAGSEVIFSHYVFQLALSALPLLLLGGVFVGVHHLCRSQGLAGVVIFLILLVKFTPIMTVFGLTHTLWNIADSPLQGADNYWGYEASLSVYLPYMSVWLLVIGAFVLVAINHSHRGSGLTALRLLSLPKVVFAAGAVALFAAMNLHLALVAEKPLTNSHKRENWQALYEEKYAHWQNKAQPSVIAIDSKVDIYPNQQWATFELVYTIKNNTSEQISEVLVGRYGNYDAPQISIVDGKLLSFDSELNQGVYAFDKVMLPGETRKINIQFDYHQLQLWPFRSHQVVKPQFSYLRAAPLLPVIGYQTDFLDHQSVHNLQLSSVISTDIGHYGLSQGELVKQWQQDNRVVYQYQSEYESPQMPTWLSLPFEPVSREVEHTLLSVYEPSVELESKDGSEASTMYLDAMEDTFKWIGEHIKPYQGKALSVVAKPDIGAQGYPLEDIILINHTAGFRLPKKSELLYDQRYRGAVYHSARQWFMVDDVFLAKALPRYFELVLIEQRFGKEASEQLVERARQQLERQRVSTMQEPVALIDSNEDIDTHFRAIVVFAQLRDVLDDEAIITAIKQVMGLMPDANGKDFVDAMKSVSDEQFHSMIDQLFLEPPRS